MTDLACRNKQKCLNILITPILYLYSPDEAWPELPNPLDLIPPDAVLGEKEGLEISPEEAGI